MQSNIDFYFLKKIFVSGIAFLSLEEKILVEKYIDSIFEKFGINETLEKLKLLSTKDLSSIIDRSLRSKWNGLENLKTALKSKKIIESFQIKSVFYGEENFPAMLSKTQAGIKDPPYSLFYRGNLDSLKKRCVSIVGTRNANMNARKSAFDFSKDACDDDCTVISGLALGIDIESHKGALASKNSSTVAVLPGGIDVITPLSHTKYAAKIIEKNGLIMSEYLPGTPAEKFRFVQRNRIVAALSPATVVIQAPSGSGSMITASLALDYNREVFIHSANFDEQSKMLDDFKKKMLLKDVNDGKKTQKNVDLKINNSPINFVESGAKVISSYEEYKNALYI